MGKEGTKGREDKGKKGKRREGKRREGRQKKGRKADKFYRKILRVLSV